MNPIYVEVDLLARGRLDPAGLVRPEPADRRADGAESETPEADEHGGGHVFLNVQFI